MEGNFVAIIATQNWIFLYFEGFYHKQVCQECCKRILALSRILDYVTLKIPLSQDSPPLLLQCAKTMSNVKFLFPIFSSLANNMQ